MAEARDLPLLRWGEALRRERKARRRRAITAAAAAIAASSILATLAWPPRPRLLWNGSASSPVGLYRVAEAGTIERGDVAIAWPPAAARRLAAARHYLPANVPLVKPVAAVGGDRVCAAGEAVFVNGVLATLRRAADRSGRPLPWWTGCEVLAPGDIFLLAPNTGDSFDGRYFGITRARDIVGRARLTWRA
jgi:conjugative transfer signal peptidase TraF